METLNVRAKNVKPIILRALKVNRPIFIWGAPGIGKSELVQGLVDQGELGNALMIDMRLALLEPTDLRGYPFIQKQIQWNGVRLATCLVKILQTLMTMLYCF